MHCNYRHTTKQITFHVTYSFLQPFAQSNHQSGNCCLYWCMCSVGCHHVHPPPCCCAHHLRNVLGIYGGENNYLIPSCFCKFAKLQRNEWSVIFKLLLFKQIETEYQQKSPEKTHHLKVINSFAFDQVCQYLNITLTCSCSS